MRGYIPEGTTSWSVCKEGICERGIHNLVCISCPEVICEGGKLEL